MSTTQLNFDNPMPLENWVRCNPPSETAGWRAMALDSFERFASLGRGATGVLPWVVGDHTSKSIRLPVVAYNTPNGWFILRDNFNDINVSVVWDFPLTLPLQEICGRPMTFTEYRNIIARKREYTYRGWTDAEIADPRILRVQVEPAGGGTPYWREVSAEEKDRWLARYTSTEWFERDWAGGHLIPDGRQDDGRFGPDTVFYRAPPTFAEGISRLDALPRASREAPYRIGAWQFIVACAHWDAVDLLIARIMDAQNTVEAS